jgi:hypothetical protein
MQLPPFSRHLAPLRSKYKFTKSNINILQLSDNYIFVVTTLIINIFTLVNSDYFFKKYCVLFEVRGEFL